MQGAAILAEKAIWVKIPKGLNVRETEKLDMVKACEEWREILCNVMALVREVSGY